MVVAAGAFGETIATQADAPTRIADTGVAAVVFTVNQLANEEDYITAHTEAFFSRNNFFRLHGRS